MSNVIKKLRELDFAERRKTVARDRCCSALEIRGSGEWDSDGHSGLVTYDSGGVTLSSEVIGQQHVSRTELLCGPVSDSYFHSSR